MPSYLIDAVTEILERATHLINVGCGGFGWGLALWCGPVHGLSPDGAGWPVGLHRSISTAEVLRGPICIYYIQVIQLVVYSQLIIIENIGLFFPSV